MTIFEVLQIGADVIILAMLISLSSHMEVITRLLFGVKSNRDKATRCRNCGARCLEDEVKGCSRCTPEGARR